MSDLTEPRIPAVTAPPPLARLPMLQLILVGLQHVLLMYGGAVAVPLIIGQAAGLSREEIAFLINADLLVAGVATIVQSLGIGPMGLGGDTTVLGLRIEKALCHTASLPVAINFQCWANRSATEVIL